MEAGTSRSRVSCQGKRNRHVFRHGQSNEGGVRSHRGGPLDRMPKEVNTRHPVLHAAETIHLRRSYITAGIRRFKERPRGPARLGRKARDPGFR